MLNLLNRNFDGIDIFFIILISFYLFILFLFIFIFIIKLLQPSKETNKVKEKIKPNIIVNPPKEVKLDNIITPLDLPIKKEVIEPLNINNNILFKEEIKNSILNINNYFKEFYSKYFKKNNAKENKMILEHTSNLKINNYYHNNISYVKNNPHKG